MALKKSSEIIQVSGLVENNTGAFQVNAFDLQLNPLDQEVFVVLAVQIDFLGVNGGRGLPLPNLGVAGNHLFSESIALSTTRPAAQLDISDSNVFAYARRDIACEVSSGGELTFYTVAEQSSDVPDTLLDYIGIIATSDFFVGSTDTAATPTEGTNVAFRIWGYRAKADAATYAALVQSEVLSA